MFVAKNVDALRKKITKISSNFLLLKRVSSVLKLSQKNAKMNFAKGSKNNAEFCG